MTCNPVELNPGTGFARVQVAADSITPSSSGLYSEINNPVVSIVIQETEDLYNLYLNETTSSTLETTVDNLFNEIRYAYPK